ncbi:MAG: CpaF family protein [Nanoarchaeota archaeon]|nr:CpaF family protein [DPANN group archaeon]MBL7117031.1 CpaF family protein [Nanoarchaeota archaeon]
MAEEKHSKMEKPPVPSREEPSEKKGESAPEKKEETRSSEASSAPEDKLPGEPEEKPVEHKPPERRKEKALERNIIDTYEFRSKKIPITITVVRIKGEFVPIYQVSISSISKTTEFILEKIRQELIKRVNLGMLDITDTKKSEQVETKFEETITDLINKYFPDVDDEIKEFLISYLIGKSLGLGNLELLMSDVNLEEVVVNQAAEPVWVYHRKHGWLKTNIHMTDEDQIRHYSSLIGRKIGRQITVLEPLLDAHITGGDRVNATLMPISTQGNTITIRKFSRDPWTITKFIKSRTITIKAAALIWLAMQYEMSSIIAGGTASGKTSTLNVMANFFPPNQRIISIEDTREIRLPKFLHWISLNTRLPNPEGKGEISMEDLLVNSLRMRPDRILVGEVRRKREAETLFEAIHTGHSVYATFHANNAEEAIERLTNPPIDVPVIMLPAISLIIVQFRNRRTGARRTFQIAEITSDSQANVLMQYDPKKDRLVQVNKSKSLYENLKLYTGYSQSEIEKNLVEKERILKYIVDLNIDSVDGVGRVMAEYYTDKKNLMKYVASKKLLPS